jgi:hypothetical protein
MVSEYTKAVDDCILVLEAYLSVGAEDPARWTDSLIMKIREDMRTLKDA